MYIFSFFVNLHRSRSFTIILNYDLLVCSLVDSTPFLKKLISSSRVKEYQLTVVTVVTVLPVLPRKILKLLPN